MRSKGVVYQRIQSSAFYVGVTGFASAGIPSDLLGLLTLLIIPVQVLLIAFAMRGFSQEWHVEVEQPVEAGYGHSYTDPATA